MGTPIMWGDGMLPFHDELRGDVGGDVVSCKKGGLQGMTCSQFGKF
jgi:hypothetical protein